MGRLFVEQLEGHVYSCKHCRMHLAHVEELVSKVCDSMRGTREETDTRGARREKRGESEFAHGKMGE